MPLLSHFRVDLMPTPTLRSATSGTPRTPRLLWRQGLLHIFLVEGHRGTSLTSLLQNSSQSWIIDNLYHHIDDRKC